MQRPASRYIGHGGTPRPLRPAILCALLLAAGWQAQAEEAAASPESAAEPDSDARCLPDGKGYLRARLSGVLQAELAWGNEGTECTGAVRPTDGGIRMRFSRQDAAGAGTLVLVFGIADLAEGQSGRNLPVNVTVIREGEGEFYSTQGDDKCRLDEVTQQALAGPPRRSRSYRIIARGYCTAPARAVRGAGAILLSRFDYAGRVDIGEDDPPGRAEPDQALAAIMR